MARKEGRERGRFLSQWNGLFIEIFLNLHSASSARHKGSGKMLPSLACCWPNKSSVLRGRKRKRMDFEARHLMSFVTWCCFSPPCSIAFPGSSDHWPSSVCPPQCLLSYSQGSSLCFGSSLCHLSQKSQEGRIWYAG